jgi:hypothetical protein
MKNCCYRVLQKIWHYLILGIMVVLISLVYLIFMPPNQDIPLARFLPGLGYDTENWPQLDLECWLFLNVLLSMLLLWQVWQKRENNSYTSIVRYGQWKIYYRSILHLLLTISRNNLIAMLSGIAFSYLVAYLGGYTIKFSPLQSFFAAFCLILSHLLHGLWASFFLIHERFYKVAFLIHPCLIAVTCFLGVSLPRKISNFLPSTWAMLARSNWMLQDGFPLWICLGIEVVLILLSGAVFVTKKL